MGISKLLLVKGDPISIGNSKRSKEVFELRTNDFISLVNNLNKGVDYSKNLINFSLNLTIGSTLNIDLPFKKIQKTITKRQKIGWDFLITQPLYSEEDFVNLRELSKFSKCKIFAGIFPIKNKKTFKNLNNKNKVLCEQKWNLT